MTKQERDQFEPKLTKLQKARKARIAAEKTVRAAHDKLSLTSLREQDAVSEYKKACESLIAEPPSLGTDTIKVPVIVHPEGGPFSLDSVRSDF